MSGERPPVDTLASRALPGPRVALYIAPPGFGKTYRALERWNAWPRALAIDTKHQDRELPPDFPGIECWTPRELLAALRKWTDRPKFHIVYRGPVSFPEDAARPDGPRTVEPIFRAIDELEDFLLVVDEAAKFMRPAYTPGMPDAGLFRIAHEGRTKGQAFTLCAQRSALLPVDMRSCCEELWAWCPRERADFEYLRAIGLEQEQLRALDGHDAWVIRTPPGGKTTMTVVKADEPSY